MRSDEKNLKNRLILAFKVMIVQSPKHTSEIALFFNFRALQRLKPTFLNIFSNRATQNKNQNCTIFHIVAHCALFSIAKKCSKWQKICESTWTLFIWTISLMPAISVIFELLTKGICQNMLK